MKRLFLFLLIPVFFQCTGIGDKGSSSKSSIKVTSELINDRFGGVGFHVIFHTQKPTKWHYEQVFAKRWRELNPSFARVNDNPRWDKAEMDKMAYYLEMMKNTNTEIYLTSFGVQSINDYKKEIEISNQSLLRF